MDTELRQIRVLSQQNGDQITEVGITPAGATDDADDKFSPGPCLHNKKFACVFIPCVIPLSFIAGELLFGVSILCLTGVYLVGATAKFKRSSVVAFILALIAVQLTSIYCLIPYIWRSVFNVGLLFIYNVFIVLSGGVGLLQFKQLQYEEPQFVVYLEYILFVSYPITGQFVMTSVSALVMGWWSAPFFCILYGFLFIQVFYPPSKPSFVYQNSVHRAGEQTIPDRYIIGPMEKTLLLFNLITIPGSMFIIIYLLEFLHLITWVKLLFCGLFPVFLCTCLDSREVMEFLEFSSSAVSRARWSSGLSSLFIFSGLMWATGTVSTSAVPILVGSVLIGLTVGITAKTPSLEAYHPVTCLVMTVLYVLGIWSAIWNLGLGFLLSFGSLVLLLALLSAVAVLSVSAVLLSHGARKHSFGVVLVLQSLGFVVCEHLMLELKLYAVHYALISALMMLYLIYRLHTVRAVDWRASWLCGSLHCCKLALLISSLLPPRALNQSFLTPPLWNSYPALLSFLFVLVTSKLLVFSERTSLTVWEGARSCAVVGMAVIGVYDTIILPAWIFTTHRWPSLADAVAAIIFIWGLLCLRVSLMQLSHNLDAKRVNILLLCGGVLVEIVQPELNPIKAGWGAGVYFISLLLPYYSTTKTLISDDLTLPWLVLLSCLTGLAILVKLVRLEQLSARSWGLLSVFIGAPVGLKAASMLLSPHDRLPFDCLLYALSSSLVVFLLISSWQDHENMSRRMRGFSYIALVASFLLSFLLESSMDRRTTLTQTSKKEHSIPAWLSPCIPYNMALHLLLALALKSESATREDSLEDKKGKLPQAAAVMSSSFLANVSVLMSCAMGLLCTPQDYWELWVSGCTIIPVLLRPEGMVSTHGRPVNISPALPTAVVLPLCMYIGTVKAALPTSAGSLSVLGFLLEMLLLHLSLPTHYSLAHGLRKHELPLSIQRAAVFTAPMCVALFVYGSTLAGRIMGVLGLFSTYWVFYHISCPEFDNKT